MTETKLLDAILHVQAEVGTLRKDAVNPHFHSKYTPLDTIVETVGPLLQKHRLVWMTLPVYGEDGTPALYYRLSHVDTGEQIAGTMPLLLAKNDPQGLGSALTYARRYSLCAVLNLVADDDDDGNAGSGGGSLPTRTNAQDPPSDKQLKYLRTLVTQNKPPEATLKAMLIQVGAGDVDTSGKWTMELNKGQVSGLIELFKSGTLPAPDVQDIPSDVPEQPPTPSEEEWQQMLSAQEKS